MAISEGSDQSSSDLVAAINGDDEALARLGSFESQMAAMRLRHEKEIAKASTRSSQQCLKNLQNEQEVDRNLIDGLLKKF